MFLDVINEHTVKMQRQNLIHRIDFDKFNELIGYSCLAKELVFRFITIPKAIYDVETSTFSFESLSDDHNLKESCMFPPKEQRLPTANAGTPSEQDMDPTGSQTWRKSRQMWQRMKGNAPSTDEMDVLKQKSMHDDEIRSNEKLFRLNVNDENLDGVIKYWLREEKSRIKKK